MKSICFLFHLFVTLVLAIKSYPVEITCPIPQGDFYIYQTTPHPVSREKIINLLFGDKPYSMSLSMNYSVFRRMVNKDGTVIVETGFPNYTGITYNYDGLVDAAYFISQLNRYFGISNINLPEVKQITENGIKIYRTGPRTIDGLPVLFDAQYAGDGAEMTFQNQSEQNRVTIKFSWHDIGQRITLTNGVDIEKILRNSPDLAGKTVVKVETAYYYSSDDCYRPCIKAKCSDGGEYAMDIATGQAVPKYRELTGR